MSEIIDEKSDKSQEEMQYVDEIASRQRRFAAKTLTSTLIKRVTFDPTNRAHRESLQHYIEHGKWTIQFKPELPHHGVVETVKHKMIMHALTN